MAMPEAGRWQRASEQRAGKRERAGAAGRILSAQQAEVCCAWTARSKGISPGVIYGLALGAAPHPSGS